MRCWSEPRQLMYSLSAYELFSRSCPAPFCLGKENRSVCVCVNWFLHGCVCLDNCSFTPYAKGLVLKCDLAVHSYLICMHTNRCIWPMVLVTSCHKVHGWPQGGCTVRRSLSPLNVQEGNVLGRRPPTWKTRVMYTRATAAKPSQM